VTHVHYSLIGSDGFHNTIETVEKDATFVKKKAQVFNGLSLAAQLAERKEEKDTLWKKENNPFQPPRALDEDDVMYYQEMAQAARLKAQDEKALDHQGEEMFEVTTAINTTRAIKAILNLSPSLSNLLHNP